MMSFFSLVMVGVSIGLVVRDYKDKEYSGVIWGIISAIISFILIFVNLNWFGQVQGRFYAYQILDLIF